MSRVRVTNELRVCEVNGLEMRLAMPTLVIRSHWNNRERVELEIEGQRYTVIAADVEAALRNATNSR